MLDYDSRRSKLVTPLLREMRLGVISIPRVFDDPSSVPWSKLSVLIGLNTGNLMFTEAMFRLLDADVVRIGFDFHPGDVNGHLDAVVIPAANWLSQHAEWDWLVDRLEKLHVPVIVIGLGLQAANNDIHNTHVSDSALRLAWFLSQSAPVISVRGETTRRFLDKLGIRNVVVTGCPSLYMNIFDQSNPCADDFVVFQGTRYEASERFANTPSVNQIMYRLAAKLRQPIIFQSEVEEMRILTYDESMQDFSDSTRSSLSCLYGFVSDEQVYSYIKGSGHVFYDLNRWSSFVRRAKCVIGTRLHGSILALSSGRPALLIPHDSRTSEVAEFSGIQSTDGKDLFDISDTSEILSLFNASNLDHYRDTRSVNQKVFIDFLASCGLKVKIDSLF